MLYSSILKISLPEISRVMNIPYKTLYEDQQYQMQQSLNIGLY
jgi:hypothetical protein